MDCLMVSSSVECKADCVCAVDSAGGGLWIVFVMWIVWVVGSG